LRECCARFDDCRGKGDGSILGLVMVMRLLGGGLSVWDCFPWASSYVYSCIASLYGECRECRHIFRNYLLMVEGVDCGAEGCSICLFGYLPIDSSDLALMCVVNFFCSVGDAGSSWLVIRLFLFDEAL